uniref:Helix-turn-helix domain-containing protein n=1 Tax=Bosea sp. NBC_00436 TaxID=2969620 RepID=A0A9E7ZVL9_9HYPH
MKTRHPEWIRSRASRGRAIVPDRKEKDRINPPDRGVISSFSVVGPKKLCCEEEMTKSYRYLDEVAEQERISKSNVYKLVREGHLTAHKIFGRTVILNTEWEKFLGALPTAELGARKGERRGRKPKVEAAA